MVKSDEPRLVELDLAGMTCAACASRIERRLNKIDGVIATVNYATERAAVEIDSELTVEEIVEAVKSIGYQAQLRSPDGSQASSDRLVELRRRLALAISLGLPVLALSMMSFLQFDGWQWTALAFSTPVATWAAWPIHRAALANLRHGTATMDTLVSIGVSAAYLWSLWALLFTSAGSIGMTMSMSLNIRPTTDGTHHVYFEVASAVVAFILAGRYFEARAKLSAGDAIRSLLELGATDVAVVNADGTEHRIPISDLGVDDLFVVRPGEKIATDGAIIEGESAIDRSMVTGESLPEEVGPGDSVIGATINTNGRLLVRATRVGGDTEIAQIAQMVASAQSGKAPVQRLADRVAAVFVPIVVGLAVLTLAAWLIRTGEIERSFAATVAVLIVACPCALGLATPTALLVGTGRGAQLGIIIRGPEILESTRQVDTIVLDKTGTITTGTMIVGDIVPSPGHLSTEVLTIAGALEAASEHPIGAAIAAAAAAEAATSGGALPAVSEFLNTPGVGVQGVIDGQRYSIGRSLDDPGIDTASTIVELRRSASVDGEREVVVGHILVADAIRPTSQSAVARFVELGLNPILLTGDRKPTADAVAGELGITTVFSEVMPADKLALIERLRHEGRTVAMVGDGVNDAAALAHADLGIAMRSGSDVAIEASDLTLVRNDLESAVDAIRLSRKTLATIKGNLFWAFAYNVVAIPLAMTGRLSPAIAGAAMVFSSVFVVTNSLRLRTFRAVDDVKS
jgi:Cu+-exporting ATPase